MSLEALPTELDLRIIGFLDTKHKSALSRVSKYYRDVAEPLLYERVQLWGHDDHRVRQLLLTLLQRKDLRHLVKEFCCGYEEKPITCWCSRATTSLIKCLLPQLYHRYVM
jgi:hypothetical protein